MSTPFKPTDAERQANESIDPEPWRCVDWQWISNHDPIGAPCRSAVRNRHNCQYDPRPTHQGA